MASHAGQPNTADDRSQLEIIVEAYNNSEETKRQLLEWERAIGGREKAVGERERSLNSMNQALTSDKDAIKKREQSLDRRERVVRKERVARARNELLMPSPSPVPPVDLPSIHQPNRPLDFAQMQAQLLQDTSRGQRLKIGGYTSMLNSDDVFGGQVPVHEQQRQYARGLHHGGVVGVCVSTVAGHQESVVSGTPAAPNVPNEPSSAFQTHSNGAGTRSRGKRSATVSGSPVRSRPTGPLAIAMASESSPAAQQEPPPGRSFSAGSTFGPFVPRMGSPLSQVSPAPSTASTQSDAPIDLLSWATAGSHEHRIAAGEIVDGRGRRSSSSSFTIEAHESTGSPFPTTTASFSPVEHQEPARRLPDSLARELPAFRRAALAYASSVPSLQAAGHLVFPRVRLHDPAGPSAQNRYSAVPVGNHEIVSEQMWQRNIGAMLGDQPHQANGVFVNGLVMRGRDIPRLVASMTEREGEILYVVHPWMGEPVAYV